MPPPYDQSLQIPIYCISVDGHNPLYDIREQPPGYMADPPAYSPEINTEQGTDRTQLDTQTQDVTGAVRGSEGAIGRSNNVDVT